MGSLEATELEQPEVSRRKKRLKLGLELGILLVIIGAAAIFMYIINTPAVGVITPAKASGTTPVGPTYKTILGKTASFRYSNALQEVKPDSLATGDIEKFLFTNPQHPSWSLAIQVRTLPDGLLTNDGSYNLRKRNPQQYTEDKQTINGNAVSIMSDQSGTYSKVAFIAHATMVAEIALSGSGDDSQSQQIFTGILESWHWL